MRSKKKLRLNNSAPKIKTLVKRTNTNKTKKRLKKFTQKAGADNENTTTESVPATNGNTNTEVSNRSETTVERALREQKELEEKIKEEVEEMGYDTEEITKTLETQQHVEKKGFFSRMPKNFNYNNVLTYGKASKNKLLKKIAIEKVKEKNPTFEDKVIETMAVKLLNYVHNKYIEDDKDRYELLTEGLQSNDVQKSLEDDDEFADSYVDRMNRELQSLKDTGQISKSNMYEFFKLASGVFDKDKLQIAKGKIKEFKDLFKGELQENRFVLFFSKLNREFKGPFTTEQIERRVALMFRLYRIRTTIRSLKIRTPWFTPLSEYSKQFKYYRHRKANAFKKTMKRSVSEFLEDGYEECSLIKELSGNERSLLNDTFVDKIIRRIVEGDFFKKEDKYFLGLLKKNTRTFCFKNKETDDDFEYSRFCKRLTKCLKTPNLLHELLFDAIDAKATKRMFDQLSLPEREALTQRMKENNPLVFKKKLGDTPDERDTLALVLSLVQDENLRSLSKFLKHVIIKTFLDYKESASKAPQGTYTGNIVAEPYFDDIFKLLTEKTPENEEEEEEEKGDNEDDESEAENNATNQSGGSKVSYKSIKDKMAKSGSKPIFTAAELKRISEDDLYKGLKNCDKKDLIKSDYDKRTQEGTDELGNEFDQDDEGIDSIGEGMDNPKLLYILMGSLIVVGVIESGFLDAPPCMTHTII